MIPVADTAVKKENPRISYFAPGPENRKVYLNNHVQFVYAKKGDDIERIAADFDLSPSKIAGYNDIDKNANLEEGQIIYLGKKMAKGRGQPACYCERRDDVGYLPAIRCQAQQTV